LTTATDIDARLLCELEQFLYREARFQDEHRYAEWEALWTDDAVYWVPAMSDDSDPEREMAVIYDNRSRIAKRVAQLNTGKRHAQTPPSRLRHLVTNVELLEQAEEDEYLVGSNFLIIESRERGKAIFAGRFEHRLRRLEGELRIATKKVMLVDNDRALRTMAFLI
jgi:3-phenylpropionate/cinnamic acid dioxygenase small subunit